MRLLLRAGSIFLVLAVAMVRPPTAAAQATLSARAARDGHARVIVGVRAPLIAEGRLAAPAVAAQRASIRSRVDAVAARLGASDLRSLRRFRTIPFFAADVGPGALRQLQADPDVASVEEDVVDTPVLADSVPLIGAPAVWRAGYTGAGWTIAVLDTGVDLSHPFLAGKVVSEACYSNAGGTGGGTSLCPAQALSSVSPGSGVNCSVDISGCEHGTHVAGIAAGRGTDFSGVARDASLASIQVFTALPAALCGGSSCVGSFASDQVLGLERVLELQATLHVAAVNMSLSGFQDFTDTASCDAANGARKAAIDNLRSVGVATVIASGNNGFVDGLSAPACISTAVSVGSSTKSDVISSFSNAAPFLSLIAPGESITSSVPGGGFAALSGTSMAAPHVAGSWALMRERQPAADVATVLAALQSTGVPLSDARDGLSFPRIQVDRAAAALPGSLITLDTPSAGTAIAGGFAVAGWALDPFAASATGVDAIHVYAFPANGAAIFLGAASYGLARSDVAAIYGPSFTGSGFQLDVAPLAPGSYQIVAYAHDARDSTFDTWAVASINVMSAPTAAIDSPAGSDVVSPFLVSGWAIDRDAASGAGVDAVHVYAFPDIGDPIFLGAAACCGSRPDVGAAFGSQFTASGYALTASLVPGRYTLVVYARSTVTGAFTGIARAIVVRTPGRPIVTLDTPVDGTSAGQPFLVAGWAVDLDAGAGTGIDAVHAWAFPDSGAPPTFAGSAALGGDRPDVAAVYGDQFRTAGFNLVASGLPSGSYQLVVYGHSVITNTFVSASPIRVIIP